MADGAVELGVSIAVVMAVVGIGNTVIRLWAGKTVNKNPSNLTANALLIMYG